MTFLPHFHGNLIGGTANAAGLHFKMRLDVVKGLFEGAQSVFTRLFRQIFQRTIYDGFRGTLLSVIHEPVYEPSYKTAVVHRIGQDFPVGYDTFTGHGDSSVRFLNEQFPEPPEMQPFLLILLPAAAGPTLSRLCLSLVNTSKRMASTKPGRHA